MATELGKAYVQIVPSAKGIGGAINKELNGSAGTSGLSAGKKIAGGIKKMIIAAGIGKVVKSALTQGGELEQNLGGTEAVFGDFAKKIQSSATDAYKNMGLSASDYMATANKMGSLFQGSGLSQQKSLELTSDAMQRAADVASVMGVDTSMAMESIAGAAKGNFTMMDNLGVAMNATSLQAYALEEGINFDWNTASQAEKSELAMKMFMDRTSQYAGNFAKESEETFSGSLGAMKSSWQNVLGQLATGGDVNGALSAFASSLVTFAQNLLPMISGILSQLPTLIVNLFSTAGPQLLTAGMEAINEIVMGIATALPTLIPQAVEAVLTLVDTFIANVPMLIDAALALIMGLADGLIAAIPVLVEKAPTIIQNIISSLLEKIPDIINAGVELLTKLVDNLPLIIETIIAVLPEIITNIIDTLVNNIPLIIDAGVQLLIALVDNLPLIIETIVSVMPRIVSSIARTLISKAPEIASTGFKLLTSLVQNLGAIIGKIVRAVPQIVSRIISAFTSKIGEFVNIGANIIGSIGNGIRNAVGSVVESAKSAAASVVNGVKNFFGIASPSKVFTEIGEFLDAGLAKGIKGNMSPVSKAMDELQGIANRSFESDIAYNLKTNKDMDRMTHDLGYQSSKSDKDFDYDKLGAIISHYMAYAVAQIKPEIVVDKRVVGRVEFGV